MESVSMTVGAHVETCRRSRAQQHRWRKARRLFQHGLRAGEHRQAERFAVAPPPGLEDEEDIGRISVIQQFGGDNSSPKCDWEGQFLTKMRLGGQFLTKMRLDLCVS